VFRLIVFRLFDAMRIKGIMNSAILCNILVTQAQLFILNIILKQFTSNYSLKWHLKSFMLNWLHFVPLNWQLLSGIAG